MTGGKAFCDLIMKRMRPRILEAHCILAVPGKSRQEDQGQRNFALKTKTKTEPETKQTTPMTSVLIEQ